MNLKQENNYEKFKQNVQTCIQTCIEETQYWINSYSINHASLLQDAKSYLEKTKNLHSQLTKYNDLSKMNIDEWNEWRKIK